VSALIVSYYLPKSTNGLMYIVDVCSWFITAAKEVVFIHVCLLAQLCQNKTTQLIIIKFGGNLEHGPWKKPLNFGGNLDHVMLGSGIKQGLGYS